MKCRLNIEVRARVSQAGNYGNALYLGGDSYCLELNTLTEAAAVLVKFLELADKLPSKAVAVEGETLTCNVSVNATR